MTVPEEYAILAWIFIPLAFLLAAIAYHAFHKDKEKP